MLLVESSVIRTAGGRVKEALKSIIVMDKLIGIGTVVIVHHTGASLSACVC